MGPRRTCSVAVVITAPRVSESLTSIGTKVRSEFSSASCLRQKPHAPYFSDSSGARFSDRCKRSTVAGSESSRFPHPPTIDNTYVPLSFRRNARRSRSPLHSGIAARCGDLRRRLLLLRLRSHLDSRRSGGRRPRLPNDVKVGASRSAARPHLASAHSTARLGWVVGPSGYRRLCRRWRVEHTHEDLRSLIDILGHGVAALLSPLDVARIARRVGSIFEVAPVVVL